MIRDCDVVVVGLGGFGAAALFHLAARGLSIVGVEAHGIPHDQGSSTGETRVIRKAYFEDARYVPLLQRAYALWAELADVVDASLCGPLFQRAGCLTFGPPGHTAVVGVQAAAREHALAHEVLDEHAIAKRFPALKPNPGDVGVFEAEAGFLHVERCTTAHVDGARRRGAVILCPARVTALRPGPEHVDVDVDEGTTLRARSVVLAAGPWLAADPVLRAFAGATPLVVERQVQLWFEPAVRASCAVPALPCFIHFGARGTFYAIPGREDDGALKACRHHGGTLTTPANVDRRVSAADVDDVRTFLRAHLPVADGEPLRSKVCLYTNTPDENFLVGPSPSSSRVIVVGGCSGHGYKMASVLGEIAADLVVDGGSPFDLGLFDPHRFGPAASR